MVSISIVIATLNRYDLLVEAIQSALSQTWGDFELLVCDDGALEETRDACEQFRDPRIRYFRHPKPLGIAMNNYSGIMLSQTDLVAFLNDDDRWMPEFLEKCGRPMLKDEERVLTFADHWLINSAGERLVEETDKNSSFYSRDLLETGLLENPLRLLATNSFPIAAASVFRKSAVDWGLYSDKIGGAYDGFISYCLLRNGGRVGYVAERLTEYRVHQRSANSTRTLENAIERLYVCDLILRDPVFQSISDTMRRKCARLQKTLARNYLRRRDLISAGASAVRTLRYW